ncbi:MAG: outer membrane beta-barrel protein [Bacteroidota bacterium]
MKKALLLFAVLVVASGVVFAQGFKVVSAGGYANVNGLLGPTGATEVQSKGGAGMGFGPFLGVGGKVRATAGSMEKIKWAGNLSYDIFVGKGSTVEITQGILKLGLGAEYGLNPMKMGAKEMWPYVTGELQIAMFMDQSFSGLPAGFTATGSGSQTRFGFGLGAGVEYPLNEKLNLDIGLRLSLPNLVGKGTGKDALAPSTAGGTDEGGWMDLQLRIGVNFSLGAAPAGGM